MKKIISFLFLCVFMFSSACLAEIQTLNQSEIWDSSVNKQNNQLVITGNENNATVSLILIPNQPASLQIIFPQAGYNFDDNTVVTFTINKFNIKLLKNLSNTNSHICIFEYIFKGNELSKFIHEFTSKKEADIELNDRMTSISLNGTSRSVSAVLKYIEDNHIPSIPDPFNNIDVSTKITIAPVSSDAIPQQHTIQNTQKINSTSDNKIFYIIGYAVAFFFIYKIIIQPLLRKRHFNNQIKKALQICFYEIEIHSMKLYIKRDQLIYKDDYGTIVYDKWLSEKQKFIKSRIEPLLYNNNLLFYYPYIEKSIQNKITEVACEKPNVSENDIITDSDVYHPNMNPLDYESFCAKKLREIGWEAQASGGQGADIEATKNGIKLVLQCKLYTKSVGSAAVQQINTAKVFYHADYAAVVSNADFTIGARQAALSTETTLLNHDELQKYAMSLTH